MTTEFLHDPQHPRVTVTRSVRGGWDVREERDGSLVREVSYTDWHRVERALQRRYDVQNVASDRPATHEDPDAK